MDTAEITFEVELPEDRVEQLIRELEGRGSAFANKYPLLHFSSVVSSGRVYTPSDRLDAFDTAAKLASLQGLRERFAAASGVRRQVESSMRALDAIRSGAHLQHSVSADCSGCPVHRASPQLSVGRNMSARALAAGTPALPAGTCEHERSQLSRSVRVQEMFQKCSWNKRSSMKPTQIRLAVKVMFGWRRATHDRWQSRQRSLGGQLVHQDSVVDGGTALASKDLLSQGDIDPSQGLLRLPAVLSSQPKAKPVQVLFRTVWSQVLTLRSQGRLSDPSSAQALLNLAVAVIRRDSTEFPGVDGVTSYVGLLIDALHQRPISAELQLMCFEALGSLFVDGPRDAGIERPIFDAVISAVTEHQDDPSLFAATPELPVRLLQLLALVLTPATCPRLGPSHINFVLAVVLELRQNPVVVERGLQILLVACNPHRWHDQVRVAVDATSTFRSISKVLVRSLLTLATVFDVAGNHMAVAENTRLTISVHHVTLVMDLHSDQRKVQGAGAASLAAAARLGTLTSAERIRVLRAVVLAYRRFPRSKSVAHHLCEIVKMFARRDPSSIHLEVILDVLQISTNFGGANLGVTVLEAVHSMAGSLNELFGDLEAVRDVAGQLAHLGIWNSASPEAVAPLLWTMVVVLDEGAPCREQWNEAFASVSAVNIPLRTLSKHRDSVPLVAASAAALRCLTSGASGSRAQVWQSQGLDVLLEALRQHGHRAMCARELLASLANCAANAFFRKDFLSCQTSEVIYRSLETSSPLDADVLCQGCRALGALTDPTSDVIDAVRLNALVSVAAASIVGRNIALGPESRVKETATLRRDLREFCSQLLVGDVASGPQGGRLIREDGEIIAKFLPRRTPFPRFDKQNGSHVADC